MNKNNFLISLTAASVSISLSGLPLLAQTQTPEFSELACQREINRQLSNSRNAFVRFDDSVEETFVSKAERRIQGEGQQVITNNNGSLVPTSFEYNCTVNTRNGRVIDAQYVLASNTRNTSNNRNTNTTTTLNNEKLISMCQEKLRNEITANVQQIDIGGIVSINTQTKPRVEFDDTTETYSVSNNEIGVRGDATVRQGNSQKPISYDCTVNIRQGTVTELDY